MGAKERAGWRDDLRSHLRSFLVKEQLFDLSAPDGTASQTVIPSARLWMRIERCFSSWMNCSRVCRLPCSTRFNSTSSICKCICSGSDEIKLCFFTDNHLIIHASCCCTMPARCSARDKKYVSIQHGENRIACMNMAQMGVINSIKEYTGVC